MKCFYIIEKLQPDTIHKTKNTHHFIVSWHTIKVDIGRHFESRRDVCDIIISIFDVKRRHYPNYKLTVVYFNQLSGAVRTRKLVKLLFFSHFQVFLFIFIFFSDFMPEINQKHLKMNKKMCFCLLLKAGGHARAGQLPEALRGYLEFVFFR